MNIVKHSEIFTKYQREAHEGESNYGFDKVFGLFKLSLK